MDDRRFDALTRVLASMPSRRALLAGLTGVLGGALAPETEAAPKRGQVCLRLGKKCKDRKHRCCGTAKCRGGRCLCSSTQKKCGNTCVPKSACCRDADCGGGGVCRNGKCACPPGMQDCEGTCIPADACCTSNDCGPCESCVDRRCQTGCQAGQECQGGTCTCTTASCDGCCAGNGTCRSGDTDGACGVGGATCRPCGNHEDCVDGACVCDTGFTACGEPPVCVNTDTDPQHCGDCGTVCATNERCVDGSCQCRAGFKPCDDGCIADELCCGGCPGNLVCWQGECESPVCGNGGPCLAFVTSATYTGNIGGLDGADDACQQLADDAELPGTYLAWLSDSETSPAERFMRSPGPYVRVDEAVIAQSWNDLTDGELNAPIRLTEQGDDVGGALTWTGTAANGTAAGATCVGWTAGVAAFGANGQANLPHSGWSNGGTVACSFPLRIYCFQQS